MSKERLSSMAHLLKVNLEFEYCLLQDVFILITISLTEITVGKVIMCNLDVFKKNVDVCMMIHPS